LADEIKKDHGIDVQMIRGRDGIFDVKVDGDLIYSKHQTGVFPEHSLILDKLSALSKAK